MFLHSPGLGWPLLLITLILTLTWPHPIRRDLTLVILALGFVSIAPISTGTDIRHMLIMGLLVTLAIVIPYLISSRIYHDNIFQLPLHKGRSWRRAEIGYIIFTAVIGYLVLPFYMSSTGSYHNWTVEPNVRSLLLLFIGTNALGIWDEVFFIATLLAVFRRHLPFVWANIAQATLWVSFLYELGFRGWGPIPVFIFALLQGEIFRRTKSIDYIIAIHLTLDFMLYLALVHAYFPSWLPIFIIQ